MNLGISNTCFKPCFSECYNWVALILVQCNVVLEVGELPFSVADCTGVEALDV